VNRSPSVNSLFAGRTTTTEPTPAPSPSAASDKENRNDDIEVATSKAGRSDSAMNPPTTRIALRDSDQSNKRRRLENTRDIRGASVVSVCPVQTLNTQYGPQEIKNESDIYYDPDQRPEYRQGLRIAIRKNHQRLNEQRGSLMRAGNTFLISSLVREDTLMDQVRQTSDAVLDSRFMMSIAELSAKKLAEEARSKGSRGIDVEEFISKAITYMKNDGAPRGEEDNTGASRHNRTQTQHNDQWDAEEDGDALEWDILGTNGAFPSNGRPAVASFLLGPLSVEKKVRNTQASARQRRDPVSALKKPEEINTEDLEKGENSNLTILCNTIKQHLIVSSEKAQEAVGEADSEDLTEAERTELFQKHHLSSNWEISLFEFAIHPHSFAQSVENLFYISFLIKDGIIRLSADSDGLPTIRKFYCFNLPRNFN
jgi:hypothetical protein